MAMSDDVEEEDYIAEIKRLQKKAPLVIKPSHMNTDGEFSANEIIDTFGTWQSALSEAGIDRGKLYYEELHRVADLLGDEPTAAEMNEYGEVSSTAISNHFGSWSTALDYAFDDGEGQVEDISQDRNGESDRGSDEDSSDGSLVQEESSETDSNDENSPGPGQKWLTWNSISDGEQLEKSTPIKLNEVATDVNSDKSEVLLIEDVDGNSFSMDLWSAHSLSRDWKVGDWYMISGVKGIVWELLGNTKKRLSSTTQTEIEYLGEDRTALESEPATNAKSDPENDGQEETSADSTDRIDQFIEDMDI